MFCILLAVLVTGINAIGQAHYECGEHGRFEYCIDGVPNCIVGCHCHPGYYFDTESKICEPNAKLVHGYRRIYGDLGPTRVPEWPEGNALAEGTTAPAAGTGTGTGPLEAHVENIAKESDDLGDWLYNQFFKTIETQVINDTAATDTTTEKPKTRRSGGTTNKKSKKSRKLEKKEKKKKDMRRRLLRIGEDDSLFDSDSSGSSSDSDSGSSSSSGSDSSDDSSRDDSCSDDGDSDKTKSSSKKKSHGHKKMIVFNKKKKPPLPSFIFLPNQMDTPFFPPLGLPGPPAIPMFPMVPVPPLQLTLTNTSGCQSSSTSSSPTSSASTPTTTISTPTPVLRGGDPKIFRSGKRRNKKIGRQRRVPKISASVAPVEMNHHNTPPGLPPLGPSGLMELDSPPIADEINEIFPVQPMPMPRQPPVENVDFKYLAQLIHKLDDKNKSIIAGLNITRRSGNSTNPISSTTEATRRAVDSGVGRNLSSPEGDENYYSKLGQEIASLIRKIDTSGGRRVNIEIERRVKDTPAQPVFSEFSYSPRSYWERSVRSLLKHFPTYNDDIFPLKGYEESLFNLERKVETVATTVSPLSLNDLENVISVIDKTKAQLKLNETNDNENQTEQNRIENEHSLNVNLLPHQEEHPDEHRESEKRVRQVYVKKPTRVKLMSDTQKIKNYPEMIKKYVNEKDMEILRSFLLQNINKMKRLQTETPNNFETITNRIETLDTEAVFNYETSTSKMRKLETVAPYNYETNINKIQKLEAKAPYKYYEPNLNEIKTMETIVPYIYETTKKPIVNSTYLFNKIQRTEQYEIDKVQRLVGANSQSTSKTRDHRLLKMPWLEPNMLAQHGGRQIRLGYHSPDKHLHTSDKYIPLPINIKFKLAPRNHNAEFQDAAKYFADKSDHLYHHRTPKVVMHVPIKRTSLLKSQPSYFHHELQHLDFFN